MGTDIHFFVEKRQDEASPWISADTWVEEKYNTYSWTRPKPEFYSTRNYDLFAILANVRNGRGFAGVVTGAGFVSISEPRGWPEDLSPEVAQQEPEYSSSWLTLDEILTFDWTQITTKSGIVTLEEWAKWRAFGEPTSWCGGIDGKGILQLEIEQVNKAADRICPIEAGGKYKFHYTGSEEMTRLREELGETQGVQVYTRVDWRVSYAEATKEFWYNTVPKLLRLGEPSNVRCVFFFDS